MKFEQWLDTFLDEKGADLEQNLEIEQGGYLHLLPVQIVISGIKNLDVKRKNKIKTILISIDFLDGDIMDFFRDLGKGYIEQNFIDVIGA